MKTKLKEHKFNSQSSNKVYTTIEYDDYTFSCNCPAWIFKKSGERNCKHIEEVKNNLNNFKEVVVQEIKEVLEIEYRK